MRGTVETHEGPDQSPRSNRYLARVEERAVRVDEDIAANFEVRAVVDADGALNPGVGV